MQARYDRNSDGYDDLEGLIAETREFVTSRQEKLNVLQSQSPVGNAAPRSQSPLSENDTHRRPRSAMNAVTVGDRNLSGEDRSTGL